MCGVKRICLLVPEAVSLTGDVEAVFTTPPTAPAHSQVTSSFLRLNLSRPETAQAVPTPLTRRADSTTVSLVTKDCIRYHSVKLRHPLIDPPLPPCSSATRSPFAHPQNCLAVYGFEICVKNVSAGSKDLGEARRGGGLTRHKVNFHGSQAAFDKSY